MFTIQNMSLKPLCFTFGLRFFSWNPAYAKHVFCSALVQRALFYTFCCLFTFSVKSFILTFIFVFRKQNIPSFHTTGKISLCESMHFYIHGSRDCHCSHLDIWDNCSSVRKVAVLQLEGSSLIFACTCQCLTLTGSCLPLCISVCANG